jgi:hypothetical protein
VKNQPIIVSRTCQPLRLSLLLALVGVAGCGGTSSSAAQGTSEPSSAAPAGAAAHTAPTINSAQAHTVSLLGSSAGVKLLRRVTSSYGPVPAVVLTASLHGLSAQFTVILRRGIVVAEQFVGESASGTTKLVAPPHSATYALEPGTTCWRPLSASNPQVLMDIGERFPILPRAVAVSAPQQTRGGWLLRVRALNITSTYAVDRATLHVDSITIAEGRRSFTERVQALSAAPALLTPTPRC